MKFEHSSSKIPMERQQSRKCVVNILLKIIRNEGYVK